MFDDDDATRRALHPLTDDPAPPVTTTVDEVLRRGRRRVFVQRVGTFAGVAGVVAAIGVGAVLLRDQSGGIQVGDTNSASPPGLTTTGPPSQTRTEQSTPLVNGGFRWDRVDMPPDADPGSGCVPMSQPPPEHEVALLSEATVKTAFSDAVAKTITQQTIVVTSEWLEHSAKQDGAPRGYVHALVGSSGRFELEAGRFGSTPEEFADWARTVYGNCDPPWRRVLDDGTVLQLFPVSADGTQHLQIYRPDGRLYTISSIGLEIGSAHGVQVSLDLCDIAERLVQNLG
jgi:hypothetical protein